MSLDEPGADEVLAMRFDEPAAAEDLAAWCGGRVVQVEREGGRLEPVIWVPTARGPRGLTLGMWVKRLPDGSYAVNTPEDFLARHEPA